MSPSPDLEDGFKEVMAAIADLLKPRDFKKKGRTWTRRCDGGEVLVNVQRSQWNDGDALTFYINLSARADALGDYDELSERLGSSWNIKPRTDATKLAKKVRRALEKDGLPLLDEVCGAEALRDFWLARMDDDTTPHSKLAKLLEAIGPKKHIAEAERSFEEGRRRRERHAAKDG